ncbi:hypothetical protein BJ138DRAFT_1061540 [Hygrophoropsis aurantiaca]|uniref:Uncharacterized protein n=1 Tax=Hygrophoropsis aurantiaca TaxID=72124 RepID=A0ACB8AFU1_9AGAM|nr:hypothetical protein BJ138DRAFT_1061540 [Hygrophoropsis aurantiaca]
MAYRDPYAEQYGRYDQQYGEAPAFNPYSNTQPHQSYDQGGYDAYGGYRDEPSATTQGVVSAHSPENAKEMNAFDRAEFARGHTGSRSRDLRHWRYDHQGALWTRGSRGRCVGRFCCCSIMIVVFFVVSILLALALWIRPPNVIVGSVQPTTTGNQIELQSNGVTINLGVNISVSNPNYFSVSFSKINANIYYPIDNTQVLIGNGNETDITFAAHSNKTFTFPFAIDYTTTMQDSSAIFAELEQKCGASGAASDITVNYEITLGLRILFFVVSPTVSNSLSFACPLSADDISKLIPLISGGNI